MIDLYAMFPTELLKLPPEILAKRDLYKRFYEAAK